jgi:NAD(P)-dependent dehydrogenase (short-subunit alcohol dehydrogenase family)
VVARHAAAPVGRVGRPEESAEAVARLVSGRARHVVGAN